MSDSTDWTREQAPTDWAREPSNGGAVSNVRAIERYHRERGWTPRPTLWQRFLAWLIGDLA